MFLAAKWFFLVLDYLPNSVVLGLFGEVQGHGAAGFDAIDAGGDHRQGVGQEHGGEDGGALGAREAGLEAPLLPPRHHPQEGSAAVAGLAGPAAFELRLDSGPVELREAHELP